jgi:hypothetical protein
VPAGFDHRGLPLAVQVVAAHGRDDLCIAAALALESSQPPWHPAPLPSCIQSDTLEDAAEPDAGGGMLPAMPRHGARG